MHNYNLPHNHGQKIEEIVENLPKTEDFQTISDLFRLLGDASRVKIFWLLCHAEECVINISAVMEMSSPAVSHHLKQLKSSGLIVSRRDGKEVYYKAADTVQVKTLHNMLELVTAAACPDSCVYTESKKS